MNIVIWFDEWEGWAYPAGGQNLAQRIIQAASDSSCVRRIAVIQSQRWATGASGKAPLFVAPVSTGGLAPPISMFWESGTPDQLARIYRICDFESALVLGKSHVYMWPFMVQEVFEGKTNKEYGLQRTQWSEVIGGASNLFLDACRFPHDPLTLQYVYTEMTAGAAWEDILTELESNGKQEQVPSEH
jgi:hypothetical protein